MARPRKLPDADELHRLRVVEHKTYDEIADMYDVTRAAVHLALRKSGLVNPRPRYTRQIPWTVRVQHANSYDLSMLRLAARREIGQPIPPYKEKYLDTWLEVLNRKTPEAPHGCVIDYHPTWYHEGQGGFDMVPRRPGVDTWLIREPEHEDVEATAS